MELIKNYQFEVGKYYLYYDNDYLKSIYFYRLSSIVDDRGTKIVHESRLIKSIILIDNDNDYECLETIINEEVYTYKFDKMGSIFYKLTDDETLLLLSEGI